ncbi:MAG: hypothetical protein IKU15_05060 [Clostridia bacterium]|nr:hypothetical protein [Clostridia bacterium]
MAYLSEQVSYLKGLAEGMKIDDSKNEGKLLMKIIDVLDEMAMSFEELDEEVLDNTERLDDVEDCLDDICEDLYDDECDCGCDCDCDCDCDDDFDDMDFYEVECPSCNEKVYFDEDMINDESLICPNCNEKIEIEFEVEEE